jgi:hypothetical protein
MLSFRMAIRDFLRPAKRKPHIVVIGHSAGAELYGSERTLLYILAAVDRGRYDLSCILPATNPEYLQAVAKYTENVIVFPYHWWTKTRPYDRKTVARSYRRILVMIGVRRQRIELAI